MFGAARVGGLIVLAVATAASLLLLALMLLTLRPTPTHVVRAEPVTVAESERVTKVAQPIEPVAVGSPPRRFVLLSKSRQSGLLSQ
jgi:hypothetical protein